MRTGPQSTSIEPSHTPYHHGDLRAALIRAGEEELNEKGVEAFSLRGCAKRAGVSHAAPAHHFGDTRGLLTALATEGFRAFVATQQAAMDEAAIDPASQLAAAGLGYVRFALSRPALFRLIFSSDKPNFDNRDLETAATAAYELLVAQIGSVCGTAPELEDIAAVWSAAHGLADLLAAGRLKSVLALPLPQRDAMILRIVMRALPPASLRPQPAPR